MAPRDPSAKLVAFRLSQEARRLLREFAKKHAMTMTMALEEIIRKVTRRD
jgi:hypothetical protein